jgi:hypothetical protein
MAPFFRVPPRSAVLMTLVVSKAQMDVYFTYDEVIRYTNGKTQIIESREGV